MHLRYEVTTQCCVLGSFSESIQRNNVSHPLDLMDDSVSVGHVGSVGHSGLTALSDHSFYLCLDLFYEVKEKSFNLLALWSATVGIMKWAPTLDMRVLDEVDQAPLQGLWRGFAAGHEQIQTTQSQVSFLKALFTASVVLSVRLEAEHT